MNTDIAKKPLLSNMGENFHYMKVIAQNNLEIKKLELVNEGVNFGGKFIFATIIGVLAFALFNVLVVLSIFLLSEILGSWLQALGVVAFALLFLLIILYIFKSKLTKRFTNSLVATINI